MTREDIIRMAREAGFSFNSLGGTYTSGKLNDYLMRFAALVASAERETCADECVKLAIGGGFAADCAAAIRARNKT